MSELIFKWLDFNVQTIFNNYLLIIIITYIYILTDWLCYRIIRSKSNNSYFNFCISHCARFRHFSELTHMMDYAYAVKAINL